MNELHHLLEQATDRVESPDLAAVALEVARRRRTARRGALAAGAVAALVVIIALIGQLGGTDPRRPPIAPTPTPTPTTGVQAWDPRTVDDLPAAADEVAPLLPDVLEVPTSAPALAEQPIEAAVLTVREDDALYLLAVDGSWRQVPPPPMPQGAELTRDGTRLAVERGGGVDVWDLPTGERSRVEAPLGHEPWEFTSWRWVDNDALLLDDAEGGWRVDTITGVADEVPYPRPGSFHWTVDPRGAVVESADWTYPDVLTDWGGGVRRQVDMSPTGRLSWVQADKDTVVGTSDENRPFSVYVADRFDLTPREVLAVNDHEANYSNGGLSVVALLKDGTVLMKVAVFDREMSWRLVAWNPETDDLSIVTSSDGTVPLWSLALGLLG